MMSQAGITVKQYQSGNGRFTDNGFIESINQKYQKITFCGFGGAPPEWYSRKKE